MLRSHWCQKEEMATVEFLVVLAILAGELIVHGQPGDTLTPAKPLEDGHTLTSAGEAFELGFFSPGNSNKRFLGIWYKGIPDQRVVWVANRDTPLNESTGVLNLTADGDLLLLNGAMNTLWSTRTSNASQPLLQLLDSGNLILMEEASKNIIWQSFDHPCDTFLPGMKLGLDLTTNLDRYLTSWKSASDPFPGDYSYRMDRRGVPQVFIWKGLSPIFRTGPWNGKGFSSRPETAANPVLKFQYVADQNEIYYTFEMSNKSFFSLSVIDESGVLQRLMQSSQSNRWDHYWWAPQDPCDQYATCGANGNCTTEYSPMCQCLQGFIPKSPKDWYLRQYSDGCVRRTALHCSSDGFSILQKVKLPDTMNASAESSKTLDECRDLCRKNCSCMAFAITSDSRCLTWPGDLVDIRAFTEGGDDICIRLAASEFDSINGNSGKKILLLVIIILPVLSFLLLLFVGLLLWLKRRRKHGDVEQHSTMDYDVSEQHCDSTMINSEDANENNEGADLGNILGALPSYDLATIKAATNDFSDDNKLGQGGFGAVYKGQLQDGQEIAVKKLSRFSSQGPDEFKNELLLIANLQHRNLVGLLGACIEGVEQLLILEYMENKSLDSFIYDKTKSVLLSWQKRLDIILGIARGLLYLHQDSNMRVIHRDLKLSNILLDKDMNPKISDFGIARIFEGDDIHENATTRLVGTFGYMAPEYLSSGVFSVKSDVFSFGVIVLEILSGKRNRVFNQADMRLNLLGHACKLWKEGRSLEILDDALDCSYPMAEILRCIRMGLLCVQENSEDRPTMAEVVMMLASEDQMLTRLKQPIITSAISEGEYSKEITITITGR